MTWVLLVPSACSRSYTVSRLKLVRKNGLNSGLSALQCYENGWQHSMVCDPMNGSSSSSYQSLSCFRGPPACFSPSPRQSHGYRVI
ncbi:hypothetical protein FBUS_09345 [Fasciolopsis buskii]|uniref:Uncharacterized protein n=1 Tax=Fasciolopsis buskii TaxID=27845 RepID=A0A8E0S1B3_9TREM|nr:hypothetical protein FBUS_09345 [Fasciolopsis buski]